MSRFYTLCSSSSGNCCYIGHSGGGILIDAGGNCKRLTEALSSQKIGPEEIGAIFITHEHSDHVGALKVFAKKYKIPVISRQDTVDVLKNSAEDLEYIVLNGEGEDVAGMRVECFSLSHDAVSPCGYAVTLPDERKISVLTDTGTVTNEMLEKIKGSDLVLLEANYDNAMLEYGPYPPSLKYRIRSERGHLSNDYAAATACRLVSMGTTRIVLGHLSTNNNMPQKAFSAVENALGAMGAVKDSDYILSVATKGPAAYTTVF